MVNMLPDKRIKRVLDERNITLDTLENRSWEIEGGVINPLAHKKYPRTAEYRYHLKRKDYKQKLRGQIKRLLRDKKCQKKNGQAKNV